MNALQSIRLRLADSPDNQSSKVLASLAIALESQTPFPIAELYDLDYDSFQLALDLLKAWRLGRYYTSRLELRDIAPHANLQ